ncbi:putative Calcium-binding protein [Danaus plexippus plexippus]|uniref:Calcium-binding protein n=1 Tax=Danaus plexippus plexippus TaxID=278856 RepID=A0A212EHA4_DANPL|nr:muscle M-line assembly protein unc-89 [Danaus plexippus plexippus]OWR40873.1 putative Calcium-binding protein [Danaus plexippus plexippus]
MSTRSGKRIHSSDIENIEKIVELQTVRKTRIKKQKENCDEVATAKKKRNFVKRPSGDETESLNDKTELATKGSRKSRRNTLKELNVVDIDSEILHDKTSMRHSRRIRKEDAEPTNVLVEEDIKSKEKKKTKKRKVTVTEKIDIEPEAIIIPKKKSNKKKNKNSNSFIVEDLALPREDMSFNRSNVSADSFHSAAGSPDKLDNEAKSDDKRHKRREKKIISSTTCDNTANENYKGKKKNKKIEKDKTQKLGFKEKSFEEIESKFEPIDTKSEMSFDNKNCESLKTKSKKKKKKSKENNSLNDVNTNTSSDNVDVDLKSPSECELPGSLNSSIKVSPQNRWKGITMSDVNGIASTTYMPDVNGIERTPDKTKPNSSSKKRRKSNGNIPDSNEIDTSIALLNESHNGSSRSSNQLTNKKEMRKSIDKDSTYDKLSGTGIHNTVDRDSCGNNTTSNKKESLNDRRGSHRRSDIQNNTYDKTDDKGFNLNATFDKEITENTSDSSTYVGRKSRSSKFSLEECETSTVLNGTYDKSIEITSTLNNTFDKPKLDATFECTDDKKHVESRTTSSIMSSDNTNMTSDMSEDCSRISITSDDSRSEHIVNTTPLLIESSMDESQANKTVTPVKDDASEVKNTPDKQSTTELSNRTPLKRDGTYTDLRKTPLKRQGTFTEDPTPGAADATPVTPLKREGTFTKDSPPGSPKVSDKTPTRRKSMPSPGRTPFPFSKSSSKEKSMLNITHSIEKPKRRSSVAAAAPRLTKVMFCSPVDNPASTTLVKGKVIKSNLKGSNKSFVFDESVCESPSVPRKRSLTHGSEVGEAKRARLAPGSQYRARTTSAAARLQDPGTPKKDATPSKSKQPRTKLPNFAALHQKHFGKMESLDECQERKAKRARQLLTPSTHTHTHADATSPRETTDVQPTSKKAETPPETKTIEKKIYTKFGFKLNPDVNPFSIPSKSTIKPKDNVIKQGLRRQATLPSLAGTTLRKEAAKQTVMREKSFTDKRDEARRENRTVIKGVRTNRRFELQMKMRNIN